MKNGAVWVVVGIMALMRTGPVQGQDLQNGLVLQYSFDADGGDVVPDSSGYGRTAQVHEAIWVPDGVRGGAFRFDTREQCLVADDKGLPEGDAPRTLAFWVKLNVLYPEKVTGLVSYGEHRQHHFCGVGMDWRHGRRQFYFTQCGGVALSEWKMPEPGHWHHLAYVYGGNGMHRFYVDGAPSIGSSELSGPVSTILSGRLVIGGPPESVGPNGGFLDDVRIYDRALTDGEVALLARLPADSNGPDGSASGSHAAASREEDSGTDSGMPDRDAAAGLDMGRPFEVRSAQHSTREEAFVLEWICVPGRSYEILWTEDLMDGFHVLASNLVAVTDEMAYTNHVAGAKKAFYVIREQSE